MTSRNRPGAATIVAERRPRRFGIVVTALYGGCFLYPVVAGRYRLDLDKRSPRWITHIPTMVVAADLAVVTAALIWGLSRSWRMGLYMDHKGVTVRNYFRTYRFGWADLPRLVDGSLTGQAWWALSVVAASGRAVTASGTASSTRARDDSLATIRQAAEFYGIATDLTGFPGPWRGPKWRTYLPVILLFILIALLLASMLLVRGGSDLHCPPPSCAD